jgi:hypothetical protein
MGTYFYPIICKNDFTNHFYESSFNEKIFYFSCRVPIGVPQWGEGPKMRLCEGIVGLID